MHADELLRHRAFLRNLAAALLGGEDGADDVVQDAYVKALERRPSDPRAWLAAVVRNLVRRRWRTQARRHTRERVAARPEAVANTGDAVARLEVQRRAVDAVLSMPEPYRTTIVQRFLEGRSVRAIAAATDTPYETVRTRLSRALAMLRRSLDESGRGWAPALAPLLAFSRPVTLGVLTMTVNKTIALGAVMLLGVAVGVAGHATWMKRAPAPPRAPTERAVVGGPDPAEAAQLRARVGQLLEQNETLRARVASLEADPGARKPADLGPVSRGKSAVDWSELIPLFRELARSRANPGGRIDAAQRKRLDDLIGALAEQGHMRDGMQMQDLWRVPTVAGHIAFAFAREREPKLDDALREEIERALQGIESRLPDDALDIERLAAVEEQLAETESIVALRASADTARRVAAEVTPLWKRPYWKALYLGRVSAADLESLIVQMTGAMSAAEKERLPALVERLVSAHAQVRADLVQKHGEDAIRAVLTEPGTAGPDEPRLVLARKKDGFARVTQRAKTAFARHQAQFEREHVQQLGPAARKQHGQLVATLLLYEVRR